MVACVLTRPEAVLLLMCATFEHLSRRNWRAAMWVGGCGLAAVMLQFSAYFLYYGSSVPHPVIFKQLAIYYTREPRLGLADVVAYLTPYKQIVLLFLLAPLACYRIRGFWAAWSFCMVLSAACVSGPRSDYGRYCLPFLIVMVGLSGLCLTQLADAAAKWPKVWRNRTFSILCLIVLWEAWRLNADLNPERAFHLNEFTRIARHQKARLALGHKIREEVPIDAIVISSDIGAIAYTAPEHTFFDACGLTTIGPVEAAQQGDWRSLAMQLKRMRPRFIADTWFKGSFQSQKILAHPKTFFRGSQRGRIVITTTMREPHTIEGYAFELAKIKKIQFNQ